MRIEAVRDVRGAERMTRQSCFTAEQPEMSCIDSESARVGVLLVVNWTCGN